jgi:xylan 1,4-beta-xylosidase
MASATRMENSGLRVTKRSKHIWVVAILLCNLHATAQDASPHVSIRVDASHETGPWQPIWNYFGYDEPNYTYSPNGKKLLHELAELSAVPVYIRTHNLFTSGDGSASLKWGSTNVYTEDAGGDPVYDWTIVDQIFDTYHNLGVKPLVELGFMPEALSTHPQPYRHNFPKGPIFTGWTYPPRDYNKWANLVFHFTEHLRERYGTEEVRTWLWEVWNEPDIPYWKGTREEYLKIYDYSADAVLRALPGAVIGGPDTTGPGAENAAEFLRAFLEHCAHGRNYVTGKTGAPLDFVSFHPKGSPVVENGRVRMGSSHHLAVIQRGFQIVASFPEWRQTPIILGESDPEGCAACSAQDHPENAYRNGPLYAAYTVAILNQIYSLAARERINFRGAVTWAFEFEDQPYFAGYRELATNGIDKPVLNAFRMLGLMGSRRLEVHSTGAIPSDEMVGAGTRSRGDVTALATRRDREITILAWNYQDDEMPADNVPIDLSVSQIPVQAERVLVEHFRIDRDHSNAYEAWKGMGSPLQPSTDEYRKIEEAGQLQEITSPQWMDTKKGQIALSFSLPREALSLIRITW